MENVQKEAVKKWNPQGVVALTDWTSEKRRKKVRDTRNEGSVIRRYLIKSKRKK